MNMTTEQVLAKLLEHGFEIEQIEADKFMCYGNDRFNFCSDENPFIVDSDSLFDIYEQYIEEITE